MLAAAMATCSVARAERGFVDGPYGRATHDAKATLKSDAMVHKVVRAGGAVARKAAA